jgi:predicted AlkP superfamily phosphohydrolase/phosphomutase
VFLASDHGFGPTKEIFYVNVLLEQLGFLRWSRNVPHDREGRLTADGHRSSVVLFDWADTTACALTASSNGVWIRVAGDGDVGGISPEDYGEVRGRIIDGLLEFRDPDTGEPVVQKVLTREQAFPGTASQQAPDLTLVLRDHGFISVLNADQPLKPRGSIIGVHRPEGILIAAGPGIRSGVVFPEASIMDVAPTLLHSLGLQVPEDFEGHVITDVFEPSLLVERPVASGPRTEPPSVYRTEAAHSGLTPDDEEQVVQRLTALGYLE